MKKIELLAPSGDLERLKVAFAYGADAVYIGGKKYSLRARASNFDIDDIKKSVEIAKLYNAKVYVTCNIIAHNEDLENLDVLKEYLITLEKIGVSAIICSDLAIIDVATQILNTMEIHISTQLSSMNNESLKFFSDPKITRVVLARECSLKDIKRISKISCKELEVFIHGGMCMSISGKCVLSNYLTSRDANRGGCAQSCRWFYELYDEHKKTITPNKFTFSSKDLQATKFIKKLIKYNVASLKIEGRMKSEYYLATIISQYRKLIDDLYEHKKIKYKKYINEMKRAESRPTSCGFFKGKVTTAQQIFDRTAEIPLQDFVARVLDYDKKNKIVTIEQRNNFTIKKPFEIITPTGTFSLEIDNMWNKENETIEVAKHAKEILYFRSNHPFTNVDMLRQSK